MSLSAGDRLGAYEILAPLGAGGMGEVYRATDTKLGRDVAIKVLPAEVADDAQRLGRFEREAHLLASLNHPNIAAIYGLEEANGQPFLVLELVEGEDLKERLDRGTIPLGEALEIAQQIAEALEEAHAHGIVHRDLKPANVKLTADGKVKVLDFGLAKAWAGETGTGTSSVDLSASPTLARSGTLAGVILGTAAYMSPEQASGKAVDKRGDIWSFGVVLYEMLSGRSLFTGETASEILASVIKEEPDWERLPADCPASVRRLLGRCLRKKPRERLQDIGDARLELAESRTGEGAAPAIAGASPAVTASLRRARGTAAALGLALVGLLTIVVIRDNSRKATATPPLRRLSLQFTQEGLSGRVLSFTVSPDGGRVAFTLDSDGSVWVRPLDSDTPRRLPVSDADHCTLWSPDGAEILCVMRVRADTWELRAVGVDGVTERRIWQGTSRNFSVGSWQGDQILLTLDPPGEDGCRVHVVPASGGEASRVEAADRVGGYQWTPIWLPGGKSFLFRVYSEQPEREGVWIASVDGSVETQRVLGTTPRVLYSQGQILQAVDGVLMAHPFDPALGRVTGPPRGIASGVASVPGTHGEIGRFSVASEGVLVYAEGGTARSPHELVWFDRQGARLGVLGAPGYYEQLRLSPSGDRVAVQIPDEEGQRDQWSLDLSRGVATRMTFTADWDVAPVWSRDGTELFFCSGKRLYRTRASGSGEASLVLETPTNWYSMDLTPDGSELLCIGGGPPKQHSMMALRLGGGGEPEILMEAPPGSGFENPRLSPDGRWLAYTADETGDWDIYVSPFRREGERIKVSRSGGSQPQWRGDGAELFFATPEGWLMAATLAESEEGRLEVTELRSLFEAGVSHEYLNQYAVSRDGQRFLVITPAAGSEQAGTDSLRVILNWTSLLE